MTIGLDTIARSTGSEDNFDTVLDELFTFKPWDDEMIARGAKVKNALKEAYSQIVQNVPSSPTRTRALNTLTDCRMLANQAITFGGSV